MATRNDRHVPRRRIADDRGVHINFITDAEIYESGQIAVRTRGSKTPTVFKSLGTTAAAGQLTQGLLRRLHIAGGTWTSAETLKRVHGLSRKFLVWLGTEHSIFDLSHPSLIPALVWVGVICTGSSGAEQRNLRTFLADVLPDIRADGEIYRGYLHGRTLPVDEHHVQGYAPEVADKIESIARRSVGVWYARHREAVRTALVGLPDDWLHVDAALLIPDPTEERCPPQFAVKEADLAAAMVLLALVDDEGPNLATIQSYTCDSVERAGNHASFVTGVKARNRQIPRTPAPAGGLYSYGGLLEFLTAATRVDRVFRNHSLDFNRLLFVATGSPRAMNRDDVAKWWLRNAHRWDLPGIPFPRLSFQRLRKAAVLRGQRRGHPVIGQNPGTARLYLADALPDVILIPGLLNTQGSMTDYWRLKTASIGQAEPSPEEATDCASKHEELEPLLHAEAVMDVGVAACASNGRSPKNDDKPCGLGPVACFVCPNGYRIPEIIPGLLAMVEFTEDIRRYEPEEWVSGEAPVLNFLAQKALDQFPRHLVSAVLPDEVENSRVLIACIYLEGRSND